MIQMIIICIFVIHRFLKKVDYFAIIYLKNIVKIILFIIASEFKFKLIIMYLMIFKVIKKKFKHKINIHVHNIYTVFKDISTKINRDILLFNLKIKKIVQFLTRIYH